MGQQCFSAGRWSAVLTRIGKGYTRWLRRREKDKLVANHVFATGAAVVMIVVGSLVGQSALTFIRDGAPIYGVYHGVYARSGQPFSISILGELRYSAAAIAVGVFWLWINSFCLKRFSRRL